MGGHRNALFPNLLTLGNGVCGFYAITILCTVRIESATGALEPGQIAVFSKAAWLILFGMVFDVFDGKVARMSGSSSTLGAQLDSLCDLVTFGLAPAVMMLRLGGVHAAPAVWWERAVWFFSLAYFLGATLRLARFTAENNPDESAHLAFKGLPTPGAAGCVASLVIFYTYIMAFKAKELQWLSGFIEPETIQEAVSFVPKFLPFLGLLLGFTMVSNRLRYEHLGSRVFSKKHSFDFFVYVIFGGIVAAVLPEPILPVLFLGYLAYAPGTLVYQYFFPAKKPAAHDVRSVDV